jgi:RND family efflux transporter MFP subunit
MAVKRYSALLFGIVFFALSVMAEDIDSVLVKKESVPLERWVEGKVQAIYQSTVSAETTGRVQEILYDVGDVVPAGAVLIKLVSTEQQQQYNQAKAALTEAQTQLKLQSKELKRTTEMLSRQLIAKVDYDRVLSAVETAQARVASARAAEKSATARLSYTLVKAPFGGVVYARHVEVGEAVHPGVLLMSGFDPESLRIEADLSQYMVDAYNRWKQVRIQIDDNEFITPQNVLLFPQADAATATVRMRLELPKKQLDLIPGNFAKVAVVIDEKERLLIPLSSVVYRAEAAMVYVVNKRQLAFRQVRLGNQYGEKVEILAGLLEGEAVAIDAAAASVVMAKSHDQ